MRSTTLGAVVIASVALAFRGSPVHAKGSPQQVFVSVLDRAGNPVRDLSPADFEVREGGQRREVTRASLVGALHLRVALLVGNGFLTGSAVTPIRTGLESLASSLSQGDDVALGTISPAFRIRVKPTADRRQLVDGIELLFGMETSGTALIDGIIEMDDRFVKTARDRWPVFVIITSDSPEVSGRQIEDLNRRILELGHRGARVYAIVIKYSVKARGTEPEICEALTQSTGGTYEQVETITSVPDKVKAIETDIASTKLRARDEYVIVFTRESDNSPIDVSVPVSGVTVRVSMAP